MKSIEIEVKEPVKLLDLIVKTFPDSSRSKHKEILTHRVVVDSRRISQYDYPLTAGMKVLIEGDDVKGKRMFGDMKVVFEDRYLMVVDKPVGLLSSSSNPDDVTVISELNNYFIRRRSRQRAHVVHRLDRDTSGLMLVAKTKEVSMMLERDWKGQVYDRAYVAVTWGTPSPSVGTLRTWLTDGEFCVVSSDTDNGGKLAITHYKTLKKSNKYALVEMRLDTGRRNQIRVQFREIGHPLLKDPMYGYKDDASPLKRLGLHAYRLCFHHPVTGKDVELETPIPQDFLDLFEKRNVPTDNKNRVRHVINKNTKVKKRDGI